jgi:hypothetical protein
MLDKYLRGEATTPKHTPAEQGAAGLQATREFIAGTDGRPDAIAT